MYRIKDTCVGCHYCYHECPMRAIDYAGTRYQIDAGKCVECGLCETLCPTCSIYDDAVDATVPAHELIEKECDVVVCGAGTGLVTAVKAAQLGLKVILIEKSGHLGGNTNYAHGFFPIYTKLHQEHGFADMREEGVQELWERSGRKLDKDLIRAAVYDSGTFFDWLCKFPGTRKAFDITALGDKRAMGPIYGPAVVGFPNRLLENLLSKDPSIGPGWSGTWIKHKMLDAIPAQKLDVEIIRNLAAKSLIMKEGRAAGVVAMDGGGEVRIHAKAVVLATGGMGQSDEKLQKYFGFFDVDRPVTRFSVPGDTGDAIDMLQEIGVEPDPERMYCSLFGPAHHPFSYCLYRILEHPTCLAVNLDGRRWQNEMGNHFMGRLYIAGNPKEVSWGIFTQKNIDAIARQYIKDPSLSEESAIYRAYQADLDREAALAWAPVKKADTLEDLARQMDIAPEPFVATVQRYNRYCEAGVDEEYQKPTEFLISLEEGPYYAIYGQRFCEGAFGGLRVNPACEVTREDGTVIPGLYGVGDATSAMHQRDELAVISELTWATASAYRSALSAADYLGKGGAHRG